MPFFISYLYLFIFLLHKIYPNLFYIYISTSQIRPTQVVVYGCSLNVLLNDYF
jgi:hypothetical protein